MRAAGPDIWRKHTWRKQHAATHTQSRPFSGLSSLSNPRFAPLPVRVAHRDGKASSSADAYGAGHRHDRGLVHANASADDRTAAGCATAAADADGLHGREVLWRAGWRRGIVGVDGDRYVSRRHATAGINIVWPAAEDAACVERRGGTKSSAAATAGRSYRPSTASPDATRSAAATGRDGRACGEGHDIAGDARVDEDVADGARNCLRRHCV